MSSFYDVLDATSLHGALTVNRDADNGVGANGGRSGVAAFAIEQNPAGVHAQ